MSKTIFDWERFWCKREGQINLSDDGYLVDPKSKYGQFFAQGILPYEDLAIKPCLILLGEPGIGKSFAMRKINSLEKDIQCTLALDLGPYGSEDRLLSALNFNEVVEEWKVGNHELTILLDSLDECRLKINAIAKILSSEFAKWPVNRLRLRIACRTAEWPITLENSLEEIWGKENVDVFELAPLRRKDVEEAAIQSGLDSDSFLQEVARVRCQPLAIKPVTLEFLLNLFRKDNHLPEKESDLYLEGCKNLCDESQERKDALVTRTCDSMQRFLIAQRLAYITELSGMRIIWTGPQNGTKPDDDLPISAFLGSEPFKILDFEVSEKAIFDTLNSGLFSSRGVFRFGWAHQTYAEFLAATYLLKHLTTEQRNSLFFISDPSGSDVVPQIAEIVSRVALDDDILFDNLLTVSPKTLLNSDVAVASYRQRANLVDALISSGEEQRTRIQEVIYSNRLKNLIHSDIKVQLRPYVIDSTLAPNARIIALAIISACEVDGLKRELLALTLDKREKLQLRVEALNALKNKMDKSIASELKKLLVDAPEDPDLQLKGDALRALWPKFLSAEELFPFIVPKKNNRHLGVYDAFLAGEITSSLHSADMPAAFGWAKAQGRRHDLQYDFQKLLDGILLIGSRFLNDKALLPLFADTLVARLAIDHGHIFDRTESDPSEFLDCSIKRKVLLDEIIPRLTEIHGRAFYLSSICSGIARAEDFSYILQKAVQSKQKNEAAVWADLCHLTFDPTKVEQIGQLISAYRESEAIQDRFKGFVEPIQLDSSEANKLKDDYNEVLKIRQGRKEAPILEPPPAKRVEICLGHCETGKPCMWPSVVREMTLKAKSTHYPQTWAADIKTLPGWQNLNEAGISRMQNAAKRYLENCNDQHSEWSSESNTIYLVAHAGYQALRLVYSSDKPYILGFTADDWARWAVALFLHPLNLSDAEASHFHKPLVEQLFSNAPETGIMALEFVLTRDSSGPGFRNALSRVEHIQGSEIARFLMHQIDKNLFGPECAVQAIRFLGNRLTPEVLRYLSNKIPAPIPKCQPDWDYSLAAARELCSHATSDIWEIVSSAIYSDAQFGRELVGQLALSRQLNVPYFESLTDDQLADFFLWVSSQFPHEEDPKIEDGKEYGMRSEIADWRDQYLLRILQNRCSFSACQAIQKIKTALPHLSWLHFVWIETLKKARLATWCPLSPSELLSLTEADQNRAVSSGKQLIEVIVESLNRLQEELHDELPSVRNLWDRQRVSKKMQPITEDEMSDFVAAHFKSDILRRGIVVNREVQIRPKLGTPGQETDIHIDALIRSKDHTTADIVQCIIEAKGCWNPGLKTAMKEQLVDRYLKDNRCRFGIYLIGYFQCDEWDPDDSRKRKCPKISIEEIRQFYSEQAEELSRDGLNVRAVVLDARLK